MATKIPPTSSSSAPLIGTHNGRFHADEALAVYLLRLLPSYSNASLVRTRDPALLTTCHTVVDVGGTYDVGTHRFDHHQRGFEATFPGRTTTLSAAGLVYLHHGQAIVAARMRPEVAGGIEGGRSERGDANGNGNGASNGDETAAVVEKLWRKLYTDFVEAIDADDNGESVWGEEPTTRKRFDDGGVRLSALVGDLNMEWRDDRVPQGMLGPSPTVPAAAAAADEQAGEDARFDTASQLMGTVFLRKLAHLTERWLPARRSVVEAFQQRRQLDGSGRLMELNEPVVWKDHLYEAEAEEQDAEGGGKKRKNGEEFGRSEIFYVLYPEAKKEDAKWRVQAVPITKDSFVSRRPLRAEWRGLRDDELSGVAGIAGCVFVHAGGFIGGNMTREGAIEMARRSLV